MDSKCVSLIVLNMGGDKVDTGTAIGKLMITVLSGIAVFEAYVYFLRVKTSFGNKMFFSA